LKNIILKN